MMEGGNILAFYGRVFMKSSVIIFILLLIIIGTSDAGARIFGELALGLGGTYPQGSFSRYADPGFMVSGRATLHVPKVELFAFWCDFSFVEFARETQETWAYHEIINGPSYWTPVEQTTVEDMYGGHFGLQLSSMTMRAFFRPRAAIGIGFYHFVNKTTWDEEFPDTTITIASEVHDSQTKFGWRGLVGVDFFIIPQFGITADFVYDHVFNLKQNDGPQSSAERTSRFHGFTVGLIFMFKAE
jgi:hypothetical protein